MKLSHIVIFVSCILGLLALPILPTHSLYAEEDEISRLKQEIAGLEDKVELLETLLKKCFDSKEVQKDHLYGWQNKKNWRRLEAGMTEIQVKAILGEPARTIKGVRTLWYYPNIYCGYVSFGKNGLVTGWNEP